MTIATTTDVYASLETLYPAIQILKGDHHAALLEALAKPSPVDTVSFALEALYAAVKDGGLTGSDLSTVACACNQMAHLVTFYQWHGKTQRGADITVAMNAVADGAEPVTACATIKVDDRFSAPAPVLLAAVSAS